MNEAVGKGFRPLVKPVERNPELRVRKRVWQNRETGEVHIAGDLRDGRREPWEMVIDWHWFYPHQFPENFAAYLVPSDLKVGDEVMLADVIEDVVGFRNSSQGHTTRLHRCAARWTGEGFELLYDPDRDAGIALG